MKNNLNKLTHQKGEHRLSDVEPSSEPMFLTMPRGSLNQVMFNLFTVFLILAALAFPYTIKGASFHVPDLSGLIGNNSKAETTTNLSDDKPEIGSEVVEDDTSASVETPSGNVGADSSGSDSINKSPVASTPTGLASPVGEAAVSETESESVTMPSLSGPNSDSGSKDVYPRISIVSSDLASIGHDPKDNSLYVEFNSGGVYRYADVPVKVYEGLMKAESHGEFFNQNIKNAGFAIEKIE